jgi:hypothetical protein
MDKQINCAGWEGSHICHINGSYSYINYDDGNCLPKVIPCECENCKIKKSIKR